jgi:hypothetical protein
MKRMKYTSIIIRNLCGVLKDDSGVYEETLMSVVFKAQIYEKKNVE